jgi:hypothetical protein
VHNGLEFQNGITHDWSAPRNNHVQLRAMMHGYNVPGWQQSQGHLSAESHKTHCHKHSDMILVK